MLYIRLLILLLLSVAVHVEATSAYTVSGQVIVSAETRGMPRHLFFFQQMEGRLVAKDVHLNPQLSGYVRLQLAYRGSEEQSAGEAELAVTRLVGVDPGQTEGSRQRGHLVGMLRVLGHQKEVMIPVVIERTSEETYIIEPEKGILLANAWLQEASASQQVLGMEKDPEASAFYFKLVLQKN